MRVLDPGITLTLLPFPGETTKDVFLLLVPDFT